MSELSGAVFSPDRKHRYILYRSVVDEVLKLLPDKEVTASLPVLLFIGLNPSTANETCDDPTIRRCIGFAKQWGFGKMYMGNLFSYVTAYPKELTVENCLKNDDENRKALIKMARESSRIVFAWGNYGVLHGRGKEIAEFISTRSLVPPVCFGLNQNGQPTHPLYVPKNVEVIKYGK